MKSLNRTTNTNIENHLFKIHQFGEGNFLRAFVDWRIHKSYTSPGTNNRVVIVPPLAQGMMAPLNKQDNLYQLLLQGINSIAAGEHIIKYGNSIGPAKDNITSGQHVHSHNVQTGLDENPEYRYAPKGQPSTIIKEDRTFNGYASSNGNPGIHNERWIISTVGCVNGQAKLIVDQLKAEADTSHLDNSLVLSHQYGCSQLGGDHLNTPKALAAAIKHPNTGGVPANNQVSELKEIIGEWDTERVKFLISQEVEDEVETGRGTPFGSFIPTMKMTSNSKRVNHKHN